MHAERFESERDAQAPCPRTSDPLDRVLTFLAGIGIPCELASAGAHVKGFLEGVQIRSGGLLISLGARVSNVLHEAGHLAILPSRFRPLAQDDVDAIVTSMMNQVDVSHPDAPEVRAAMRAGDPEATAWAWAAGIHLGLAPELIIGDEEYDGTGASIRLALRMRAYAGIQGLQHAGFCAARPGPYQRALGLPAYPQLARWVQI
jgi:hypothetical protein